MATSISAQTFPSRPIALIVASAPGAGVDFFARLLGERLTIRLGQTVLVDNRPGASGMIAAAHVMKAAPDGHTILLIPNTLVIARHVLSKRANTVDIGSALTPIVLPVTTLMVLAVNDKLEVRSVTGLIAFARRNPELPYTGGVSGSPMHVLGEQFKRAAGVSLVNVPFKGVAQAIAATIGGQLQVIWMPTSGNLPYFKSGALRALATASPKRSPLMPEVPTLIELGYPDIEAVAWFGMFAPPGTSGAVVARLNQEINAILAEAAIRDRLIGLGYAPEGGTPEQLATQIREDDQRYRRLVALLNLAEE